MAEVIVNAQAPLQYDSGQRNLLDFLEKQQHSLNFQCREGFCGACRCTLISGQVRYLQEPLAYVRRGEFLPCCSVPASNIEIEIPK
ncbi:class I ribonucleotide reductase maintenance protein YfaE [Rheinheimera sp. UJ63]|uniref:class I ribonucleotide reductase maintenance protein YfaE n=1 Tax=Rheinheimera sp. UJ63 TaxID=2910157 RepID=UPI001F3A5E93|nr:class I ribonucleotide reductase maintenance protein YfaE [Rheinheimera sp. UJ63]MCF4009654.1 class I ribonucleotide reductase maintenance protein YfaE [Rheinheimera sp. UJ63]